MFERSFQPWSVWICIVFTMLRLNRACSTIDSLDFGTLPRSLAFQTSEVLKRFRKLQNALCLKLAGKNQKSQQQCPPYQKHSFCSKTLWDPLPLWSALCPCNDCDLEELRTCLPFVKHHALRPLLVSLGFSTHWFWVFFGNFGGRILRKQCRRTSLNKLPGTLTYDWNFRWLHITLVIVRGCKFYQGVLMIVLCQWYTPELSGIYEPWAYRNETSTTYQQVSKHLAISTTWQRPVMVLWADRLRLLYRKLCGQRIGAGRTENLRTVVFLFLYSNMLDGCFF